ncbi:hypothetical protein ACSQ67_003179 [Phaseolus vulgaris]
MVIRHLKIHTEIQEATSSRRASRTPPQCATPRDSRCGRGGSDSCRLPQATSRTFKFESRLIRFNSKLHFSFGFISAPV